MINNVEKDIFTQKSHDTILITKEPPFVYSAKTKVYEL